MSIGRPRIYPELVAINVMVNRASLETAKNMQLNISQICRDALDNAVNDPVQIDITNKFASIPKIEMVKVRKFVLKDTSRAGYWADWLNKKYNTKLEPSDILDWLRMR